MEINEMPLYIFYGVAVAGVMVNAIVNMRRGCMIREQLAHLGKRVQEAKSLDDEFRELNKKISRL